MSCRSLAVVGATLVGLSCNQAILTAPPGSALQLFANPTFIPANGGVSVISALVIEPVGTPVPDGTVVQFFTSLGRIDAQGKTNDGVARVNLVSDSRSGTALISAFSGGGSAPAPTPTTTLAAAPGSAVVFAAVAVSQALAFGAAAMALQNDDTVEVVIGSALPESMILTADPVTIRPDAPRESVISAFVRDKDGNSVSNVPVNFDFGDGDPLTPDGDTSTERLESEGQPRFTDNNGRAQDTLRTQYPPNSPPKSVVVRARAPQGLVETVTIRIN